MTWEIAPGAAFSRGQVLVVLETDKCLLEHYLLSPGTFLEPLVVEGFEVRFGGPLMRVRFDP